MKEAAAALLKKAESNVAAATRLLEDGHADIAASRAYYAMFYAAEAMLVEEGLEFSTHGGVHAAFGERFVKSGRVDRKFHRYLIDAFRERQAADYDAPAEVSAEDARELISRAREFLDMARRTIGA